MPALPKGPALGGLSGRNLEPRRVPAGALIGRVGLLCDDHAPEPSRPDGGAMIDFQAAPERFRHWTLTLKPPVAILAMDLAEDRPVAGAGASGVPASSAATPVRSPNLEDRP